MYRLAPKRPALNAGLLAVLLALAMSACGGNQEQADKPRPLPEVRQELRPGTYHTEEFEPSLSFEVDEGWSTEPPETSDLLVITRGETEWLIVANIKEVYDPSVDAGLMEAVETPEDMVGWFQEHPHLQTDKPERVKVGGLDAERFDVVVAANSPEAEVALFRTSDGTSHSLSEGFKTRMTVFEDVTGGTVTIGSESPTTEFDEFAPEAQKVVDSVEWRGS